MAKDEELIEREDHRTLTVAEAVSAIAGYCRAMADYGKEPKFSDLPNVLGLRAACVADRLAALAASPSPVVGYREAIADSLKHCKALILSTGREIPVADGKITLPGDLTDTERTELRGILSLSTPVVGGEALALIKRVADGEWADPGHRALMNDARAYLAALSTPVTEAAQERCEYCGDTGDVHRSDGEWLGECTCGRAMPVSKA